MNTLNYISQKIEISVQTIGSMRYRIFLNCFFHISRSLNEEDFDILADKIALRFSDLKSIWFSPYMPRKKASNKIERKARGKLYYKYYNLKKLSKDLYSGPETQRPLEESVEDTEYEGDLTEIQRSLDWLANFEENWDEAFRHWRITSAYRRKKIGENFDKTVHQIYEEWPILKTPKAAELLKLDFRLAGLCADLDVAAAYAEFFQKILSVKDYCKRDDYLDGLMNIIDDNETNESKTAIHYF